QKNFAASLDQIAERDAAGKPIEIWFQMLWRRTPPELTVQTGSVRNPTREPATMPSESIVHVAIEFSVSSWLIAARLPGAEKPRLHRIEGGDMAALLAFFAELRSRVLGRARRECRRGVQLRGRSRWVLAAPIADGAWRRDPVLEPTSILVNSRARRAKTDRLDARAMLRVLAGGDRQCAAWCACPRG